MPLCSFRPLSLSFKSKSGPSRSTQSAPLVRTKAGAMARDVPTIHPTMIFKLALRAAMSVASPCVRPPVLSVLILMA